MFGARVDVQQGTEQGAERQQHEQKGECQRDIAEDIQAGLAQFRRQVQTGLDRQRRGHPGQAMENLSVPKVTDPVQRRWAAEHFGREKNELTRHSSEDQRNDQ